MSVLRAIVCCALAACGAPQLVRVPARAHALAITDPLAPPLTFGPVAHPAVAYDEPPPADAAAIDDGGVLALLGARAAVPLVRDPRLDLVARELGALAAAGATPSDAVVEFALHAHGVVEGGHAVVGRGAAAADRVAAIVPRLGDRLAALNTRLGVAAGAGFAIVVTVETAPVTFTAVPREIDGEARITGALAAPYKLPRLRVTHDDHTVEVLSVTGDRAGFHAQLACGAHTGTQWLAVEADAQAAPLAEIPISCNAPPPATYRVEPDANLATPDVARRIAAMINRERAAAHLPPLAPDGPATAAAERYAARMAATKDVAHDLGHSTPSARLAAADRVPLALSESTLKADDFEQATEIMLDDAAYARQVVDPKATHVGIGVVADRAGELFIAIEYVQILAPIDVPALEARAAAQLVGARRTLRTGYRGNAIVRDISAAPIVDGDLSKIAREVAADIAIGWATPAVLTTLEKRLVDQEKRYSFVGHRVILVTDPAAVDVHALFDEGLVIDNVGVGAIQSNPDGVQSGLVVLVIVFGRY